jgi:AraC-like DNA-binding protein
MGRYLRRNVRDTGSGYVLVSVSSTKTMAGIGLTGARENQRLQMWRSDAWPGILFSRGMRMTHPYPRHWHEELHLCAYTSGSGYLGYRGNSHLVAEGDFVVTPPGEVHENWVDGESGVSFCGVYMDGSAFGRVSRQIAGRELTIPALRDFLVRDRLVGQRFLAMHLAAERGGSRLEQDELLLKFMQAFLSRCSAEGAVGAPVGYERFAVRRARDYIEANFNESISLAQLGGLAELSPFYLHRVFCAEIGMPPHAYQTQVRINRAKQMLRQRYSLAAVAASTGFADQSHLTRHFRRLVGVTPGRFLS